jgi:hypothetical protein
VELLEAARPVPLVGEVRFDIRDLHALVSGIREAAGEHPEHSSLATVLSAAEAVEHAAAHAQPVPLTDQVRLPRERVDELLRDLRTAGA